MPFSKEDVPGFIPENERVPELELMVQDVLATAEKPTIVSKKRHTPNKYPDHFRDKREELEYQLEEIRRIREGYDGLSGKGYGWINYAKLRDPERGKISPDFYVKQEEYFRKIEELKTKINTGLVGFKRRRWGATWAGGWDDLQDCMINPYFQIGMNSKSEHDSRLMFRNVKFMYQNLPDWLRPRSTASDRRDFMHFAWYERDASGNRITKGLQSWISSVAPTDNAHEGQAYSKLRIDEAGKQKNLLINWGYAEDCLRLGVRRVGLPIILGTVGDIDTDGAGLMELFLNNTAYDLERFMVFGYHGLMADEFGNDMLEDAIRWIIYQRKKMENATLRQIEVFRQKYPLSIDDAFLSVHGTGVGNPALISKQQMNLITDPPEARVGRMKLVTGTPQFEPNPQGYFVVYELPKGLLNGYRAVLDPAEDDDVKKTRQSSDLGFTIAGRPFGLLPLRLVAEYCHRPMKLEEAYEQFALACKLYNCKLQIEMNKGGWRAFKWFEQYHPDLLELTPKSATSAKGGVELKYGVKMTPDRKKQMVDLLEDYIDHNCLPDGQYKGIPSKKLLTQFKVFGSEHQDDDLAISWGWQAILEQADRRVAKSLGENDKDRPMHHLERVGPRLVMMNNDIPVVRRKIPKHPLLG